MIEDDGVLAVAVQNSDEPAQFYSTENSICAGAEDLSALKPFLVKIFHNFRDLCKHYFLVGDFLPERRC